MFVCGSHTCVWVPMEAEVSSDEAVLQVTVATWASWMGSQRQCRHERNFWNNSWRLWVNAMDTHPTHTSRPPLPTSPPTPAASSREVLGTQEALLKSIKGHWKDFRGAGKEHGFFPQGQGSLVSSRTQPGIAKSEAAGF